MIARSRWVVASASLLVLVPSLARGDTLFVDFSSPQGSDYSVTVLDGSGSLLSAGPTNGRFEVAGAVAAGTEPKVILQPQVNLRAGDDWAVEARFLIDVALLGSMAVRDSVQTWITVGNPIDGDDDVRSKSGLLKGGFSVGGMPIDDGYFVSSGWFIDGDSTPGTSDPEESSFIDPAAASASQTVETAVRIEYDAMLGEVTTLYRIGSGSFVPYPVMSGGQPAPPLDPVVDWFTGEAGALEVFVLIAATQAAAEPGSSGTVGGNFAIQAGDLWLDDLLVEGVFVPEPGPGSAALAALAALLGLSRRWVRPHTQDQVGR